MTHNTQLKPMVIIEFGSHNYVATFEEAGVLAPLITRLLELPRVTFDWTAKLYKPVVEDLYSSMVTLKIYSVESQQRTAAAAAMDAADNTPT